MTPLHRPFLASFALLASTLATPSFGQPSPVEESAEQLAEITLDARSTLDSALLLADAYVRPFQELEPQTVEETRRSLFLDSFGIDLLLTNSGVYSLGPSGPFDPTQHTVAETPQGTSAAIHDLYAIPVDPLAVGIDPAALDTSLFSAELFVYAAEFEGSAPHVGFLFRFTSGPHGALIFAPLVVVEDGDIDAGDAADFLHLVMVGGVDEEFDFVAWALARHGQIVTLTPGAPSGNTGTLGTPPCDKEALKDCLDARLALYQSEVATILQEEQDAINQVITLLAEFCEVSLQDTIEAAFYGGVGAGLATGNGLAIIAGAAGGVIGAGLIGLFGSSAVAEAAADQIDLIREITQQRLCQAAIEAVDDLLDCVEEYCPHSLENAFELYGERLSEMGC